LAQSDTIAMDKTGTLTEGKPRVLSVVAAGGVDDETLVRLAASLEQGSEHPFAAALLQSANEKKIPLVAPQQVDSVPGRGIRGSVDGRRVLVGSEKFLREAGVTVEPLGDRPESMVYVAVDGKSAGAFVVEDVLKATTREAIQQLRAQGVRLVMLTGDRLKTAERIARSLGIDTVYAEIQPQEKAAIVQKLQAEGRRVAMAGDGINDAPALAQADVGIAMGNGTDVAMESAAVTLLHGDLRAVVKAIRLSRATRANIRQNLFFSFLYNALGIPVAAGVLYPFTGWLLSPMIASAAMSLSSVCVIVNALRLRRVSL
jgi:P-type Cu+ transporter